MKISYESLYLKSVEIESKLVEKGITPLLKGRFKEYQNEVKKLAAAWKKRIENKEDEHVSFGGIQVLALKELRELIEILEPILSTFDRLPENSKKIVHEKLNFVLTGAAYISDEKDKTAARNYQFEFRLAAKLIEAGYEVSFFDNPDIAVLIKNRRYGIECKRITGASPRTIQANTEEAVEQLILHKDNFYAGIVALDVSALLDKRTDLLTSTSIENAGKKILDDLEAMLYRDFDRYQKLRKYSYTHLVSLFYNFSGSYVIESQNDVGWAQGTGVLVFNKENPNKASRFNSDFEKYRSGSISG